MNPKSNNHLEISVRLHPLDHKRPIFVKGNLPSKSPPVAFSWIPSASRTHSRHFRIKRESRNFAPRHELKISRIDKMDSRLPLAFLPWSIMRRSVHARACLRTSKFDTLLTSAASAQDFRHFEESLAGSLPSKLRIVVVANETVFPRSSLPPRPTYSAFRRIPLLRASSPAFTF